MASEQEASGATAPAESTADEGRSAVIVQGREEMEMHIAAIRESAAMLKTDAGKDFTGSHAKVYRRIEKERFAAGLDIIADKIERTWNESKERKAVAAIADVNLSWLTPPFDADSSEVYQNAMWKGEKFLGKEIPHTTLYDCLCAMYAAQRELGIVNGREGMEVVVGKSHDLRQLLERLHNWLGDLIKDNRVDGEGCVEASDFADDIWDVLYADDKETTIEPTSLRRDVREAIRVCKEMKQKGEIDVDKVAAILENAVERSPLPMSNMSRAKRTLLDCIARFDMIKSKDPQWKLVAESSIKECQDALAVNAEADAENRPTAQEVYDTLKDFHDDHYCSQPPPTGLTRDLVSAFYRQFVRKPDDCEPVPPLPADWKLYGKYAIRHTDGTPLKGKTYFVLRLDSDDPVEARRVSAAMSAYKGDIYNYASLHSAIYDAIMETKTLRSMLMSGASIDVVAVSLDALNKRLDLALYKHPRNCDWFKDAVVARNAFHEKAITLDPFAWMLSKFDAEQWKGEEKGEGKGESK